MALFAGRTGRQVKRGNAHFAEIGLDVATFVVAVIPSQTIADLIGFLFRENRDTAVAFFLGIEVVAVIVFGIEDFGVQLVLLGLGLLKAHHVGTLMTQPGKETFFLCGTDAIDVCRDHSHMTYPAFRIRV